MYISFFDVLKSEYCILKNRNWTLIWTGYVYDWVEFGLKYGILWPNPVCIQHLFIILLVLETAGYLDYYCNIMGIILTHHIAIKTWWWLPATRWMTFLGLSKNQKLLLKFAADILFCETVRVIIYIYLCLARSIYFTR